MSFWGNPDGADPDRNACHVSSGGGVPTAVLYFWDEIDKQENWDCDEKYLRIGEIVMKMVEREWERREAPKDE